MEALIWFRSLAIVLLIVAHAVRHVHYGSPARTVQTQQANPASSATPLVLTPELVDAIRAALAQVTVTEEQPQPAALTAPVSEQPKNASEREDEQETNNAERVKAYLTDHPEASVREIAQMLAISPSTAHKWRNRVKGASQ